MLSTKKNLRLEEFPAVFQTMLESYHTGNLSLVGACIIQIKSGEVVNNRVVYDLELLMPIPNNMPIPSSFSYVPRLMIGNCISLRYNGSYTDLGTQHLKLYQYLQDHNLEAVTGIYHIIEYSEKLENNADSIFADICIGTRKMSVPTVRTYNKTFNQYSFT